jgi:hypothetical protein
MKVLLNIQKASESLFLFLLSYSTATTGRGVVKGGKESGQREEKRVAKEEREYGKGRERGQSKGGIGSGQGREREWPRE